MLHDGGGGGGSRTIDTSVEGDPASIAAVATWLRQTVKPSAEEYGDTLHSERSAIQSAWIGGAGEGLAQQVKATGSMSDGVGSNASSAATRVDELEAGLTTVLGEMADARTTATSQGLTVEGDLIRLTGNPPPDVPDLPAGATEAERSAHDDAVALVDEWNAQVTAFTDLSEVVEAAQQIWADLCDTGVTNWTDQRQNIVSLFADGLSAGLEARIVGGYGAAYRATAAGLLDDAARFQQIALGGPRGVPLPGSLPPNATPLQVAIWEERMRIGVQNPALANDLLNRASAATDDAARLALLADEGHVPSNASRIIRGGGAALAVVGTGYSIYADIQDGESVGQAVVSNGVGLGASIAVGAAIGTAIPVPVVGTLVGAGVGAVVGIVASGMVDSLWENGVDGIEDVGQALWDGGQELVATGQAIGDLASDVGGSIADGAKDVWDSIF